MATEFRLPDLGEGVTEGEIVRWLVAEGDHVAEDQPLMEVETDKAAVEIPSPHTGVVTKLHAAEKQTVNVGDVMVTFSGSSDGGGTAAATPATAATAPRRPRPASSPAVPARSGDGRTKPASPAVRKLARKLGIDIDTVSGSGPGGRVVREDVERVAAGGVPGADTPREGTWGPVRKEPLTRARRTIAAAMARSVSTIPHVTDSDDADVTDLEHLRKGHDGPKLTMLPIVIKATAEALAKFPIFNAVYDGDAGEIVYRQYISIAVGVQTDRGLIAPVIREVDRLTIPQIAQTLGELAEKARTASFAVNDTRGGTFTISNAGAAGGSRYSTPIIQEGQAAVLALGRTRWQPCVVDGNLVPRFILPMSLSFDHRLIDGATEVQFMQEIIGRLENPASLLI